MGQGLQIQVSNVATFVGPILPGEYVINYGPGTVYLGQNMVEATAANGVLLNANSSVAWDKQGYLYAICPDAVNTFPFVQISSLPYTGIDSPAYQPWIYQGIALANPPANTDVSYVVGQDTVAELVYFEARLTTGAVAANRQMTLAIYPPIRGGTPGAGTQTNFRGMHFSSGGSATPASTTQYWVWQAGSPIGTSFFSNSNYDATDRTKWSSPIFERFILFPNTTIRTETAFLQAADQIDHVYFFLRIYPSLQAVSLS